MFASAECGSRLRLIMSARVANVDAACHELRRFLKSRGAAEAVFAVELLLRETLNNSALHGCGGDGEQVIASDIWFDNGNLYTEVRDPGPGFAWKDHLERSRQAGDDCSSSGRGLDIMRCYADEVLFNDSGNIVLLRVDVRQRGMAMTQVTKDGRKALVRPGGDIVASMADEFRKMLRALVEEGMTEMEIDLAGVAMIDSVGLGLFISAHNSLARLGGELKVVNTSRDLCELFRNMRLDQHFTVVEA